MGLLQRVCLDNVQRASILSFSLSSLLEAEPGSVARSRQFIRTVTEIRPEWLLDLAPQYYNLGTFKDGETKTALLRVIAKREGKREGKGSAAAAGGADASGKKRKKSKH